MYKTEILYVITHCHVLKALMSQLTRRFLKGHQMILKTLSILCNLDLVNSLILISNK